MFGHSFSPVISPSVGPSRCACNSSIGGILKAVSLFLLFEKYSEGPNILTKARAIKPINKTAKMHPVINPIVLFCTFVMKIECCQSGLKWEQFGCPIIELMSSIILFSSLYKCSAILQIELSLCQ